MNQVWKKHSPEEIKTRVFGALKENVSFFDTHILGVPGSYLDGKVFYKDAAFLKDAPYLSTMIQNPNHIGCHTLGKSESFFTGTHAIERKLLEICGVDILKGEVGQQDGYVASGGTEANMQAIWIYRNFYSQEHAAKNDEIAILCSADCHYSMDKAANVLSVSIYKAAIDFRSRKVSRDSFATAIKEAKAAGKKYFIIVANMMTTMFGSVDDVDLFTEVAKAENLDFKLHVDGAYGGFYYPFADDDSSLTFQNKDISSFTLDAHKMAQSPYGTGIFLIRKGLIQYANTKEASYVEGEDFTLIGSRSGANAVAVWMILCSSGPFGWQEKVFILQKRAAWLCDQLTALNIDYFRDPYSNIVTIDSTCIDAKIAEKYWLVPDNHHDPKWFKIVIMEHVTVDILSLLVADIRDQKKVG